MAGSDEQIKIARTGMRPSLTVELLAGSIAGAAQVVVGQPLDTIKTRAQIAPKEMFKGPIDILAQTIRKEGVFALYKGMLSPLIGIAGVNSLLFGAFSVAKRIITPFPDLSIQQIALAGAMAGAANSILSSPVELLKIRMQGQYGGVDDKRLSRAARDIWREWGFRNGVMRGFWVTVAREIPAYAAFYSAYEYMKKSFRARIPQGQGVPVWATLTSGSCAGMAYWLACYPLDMAKSRIQLAEKPPATGVGYIGRELATIVREQGFAGLYRGLSPCLLRTIPAGAATFAAFEMSREMLQKHTNL